MKVLIVEDESMAQASLARMLSRFTDIEIVGRCASVRDAVSFLESGPAVDLIFMDVELSDGNCFEIFRRVEVKAKIIMTTAYDNYAVKAFEVNSVDYLLKPIEPEGLERAVERARKAIAAEKSEGPISGGYDRSDVERILSAMGNAPRWRKRFLVRTNDKIVPVSVDDIACIYSEDKVNWIILADGTRYILDYTLDSVAGELDPARFFRISRNAIIALSAISRVTRLQGGRMSVMIRPDEKEEMTVSRARADAFLSWLEGAS